MKIPFGRRFGQIVPSQHVEVPFDPVTQTAVVGDVELQGLAASENTLTYTVGNDNDFDD